MTKEVREYAVEKTHELIAAPSCSKEAREAAEKWLAAEGTEEEAAVTKEYIAELEGDIVPIDMLIELAGSETGVKIFGEEKAKAIASHGVKIKAEGAKYCDCPACAAVEAILSKKEELLG